ncbi:tubulin monoglycylase TTLL3-like [Brachionichthys hirsutus]|uniref:tubulin monoglycylase TTLL3-like n=1 Tax=Brachionichthys hirsutus TaxID=412623 RepID=UPI0036044D21
MHKIFSTQGPCAVIRAALRARGWVEQLRQHPSKHAPRRHSSKDARDGDDGAGKNSGEEQDPGGLYELMCRLVKKEMVYFSWTVTRSALNRNNLHKALITNHFANTGSFTSKLGLCWNLRSLFGSADPSAFFPRCYILGQDDKLAFLEDYRRTACTSLLKYIVEREQYFQGEETSHSFQDQRIRSKQRSRPVAISKSIECALKVCQDFLDRLEPCDRDQRLETPQTLTDEEWAEFIQTYCLVVHDEAEIEESIHFVNSCKVMLHRMARVCPQLDIDGIHNIWIVKPGAQSRGRGIKCTKSLDQILKFMDGSPTTIPGSTWVVQKYLERPLLVCDTKFDVRQWFLVTDWNPLTVWFYKKCYLRFSTQPYSLDTLDSSVHLCNYEIQKKLRPSERRHQCIPAYNMWSDDQFKSFLCSQGLAGQWQAVVVPRMKKALVHTLQGVQDQMEPEKNSFELYGADFMIGCDLHPWLLEINSGPTMAPSTPVTARLCAAVQEDILRVVLDRRADRTAPTGYFQLMYQQV